MTTLITAAKETSSLASGEARTPLSPLEQNRLRLNEAAKWHQTQHEQEMSHVDTRFKLHSIHSMHSSWKTHELTKIESGPNYITASHAFVKATLRLGLRAPLVARNNDNKLKTYIAHTSCRMIAYCRGL